MAYVVLRLPVVVVRTGFSRSSIYQRIAEGKFPAPIQLGPRAVGWLESDIEAWIAARVQVRDCNVALTTGARHGNR